MKRKTKTIEKRTYSMKGAIPRFVSLVSRGANFTPLSQLRYSDAEQFGQDVEINRIEFAKAKFTTVGEVESYLNDNAYEEFSVVDSGETWTVAGVDTEAFQDVAPIEYEDGVMYFIGKLKAEEEVEAPAAEITATEEFSAEEAEEASEEVADEIVAEEVVQEADLELPAEAKAPADTPKKLKKRKLSDEEANVTSEEATGEEVSEEFSAEAEEEKVVFTQEQVDARFADLEAKIVKLEEMLAKFEDKEVETIDENTIVIQNSQAVNSDEIIHVDTKDKDERSEKFAQERKNDLFGLRGNK